MQKRALISLASATAVLVAIAIVVLATGDRGVSRAAPGQPAFPVLAAKLDEVASVTVSRNGTTMTLIRDGDSWLDVEDPEHGKSALVAVKDKSGGDLAQAIVGKRRYDRLGAGNDGVYLRKS